MNILPYTLHKTENILKVMNNDSRINPDYIAYANSVKDDVEFTLGLKK